MSYARLNTVNTDGWPVLAGMGRHLDRYANVPALGALGQDSLDYPNDPHDEFAWYDLVGKLQDINSTLIAMETEFSQSAGAVGDGPAIIGLRNQYTEVASEFQYYYTLVFGAPAAGLEGLGALAVPAIVVAGFASLAAVIYVLHENVKVKAQEAQNQNELIRISVERGIDPRELGLGPQGFMQWFQGNWQWLAVGTAAIVALPTLLKKI